MDRSYWEKIAPAYDEEIFDVLHHDKRAFIRSAIQQFASPSGTVMDIGCAVGKWIPVLSPLFKKVCAVDISAKNLRIARKKYPEYKNVEYLRTDMSGLHPKLPKCDFAICINAILTDSLKKRKQFFQNLSLCLKKSGYMILVVPSLESWLLTRIIQQQWKIDKELFAEKISPKQALLKYRNMQHGNMDIDNVPTKHYLKEELQLLLSKAGFVAEGFKKIEYNWNTEFVKPPQWLKDPFPWDWMVVAKRQ